MPRILQKNPWGRRLANLVLIGLWIWLYRPVFPYLRTIFTREEFRTNQIVLVVVLVLIGLQIRRGSLRPDLSALPQLNSPALILIFASSVAYILAERFLDINTLSASLFGLASYGLLGLWLEPARWRAGLPAALLLVGALPFGEHMQTFIGYPVRVLSASIVSRGLEAMGVQSVTLQTILVFENGISQVDLPCSGVKSLWTGGLFLLAATWLERKPLNLPWFMVAFSFSILLLVANLTRVAVLVIVGQVMEWRLFAEMLHVPLGVLGFLAACVAALGMLRRISPIPNREPESGTFLARKLKTPLWLNPVLNIFILLLVLVYAPRPQSTAAQSLPDWAPPEWLHAEIWPLSPDEINWLSIDGIDSASRWKISWDDSLQGSLLLLSSTTWRAQHRPERCFEVYGLSINSSRTVLLTNELPVRFLTLGKDSQSNLLSAGYWFQSASSVTDDYAERIWSDLNPDRSRWVLVTVLFDRLVDPQSPIFTQLMTALRESVQRSITGGS